MVGTIAGYYSVQQWIGESFFPFFCCFGKRENEWKVKRLIFRWEMRLPNSQIGQGTPCTTELPYWPKKREKRNIVFNKKGFIPRAACVCWILLPDSSSTLAFVSSIGFNTDSSRFGFCKFYFNRLTIRIFNWLSKVFPNLPGDRYRRYRQE